MAELYRWYRDLDEWALAPDASAELKRELYQFDPLCAITVTVCEGLAEQIVADGEFDVDAVSDYWEGVARELRERAFRPPGSSPKDAAGLRAGATHTLVISRAATLPRFPLYPRISRCGSTSARRIRSSSAVGGSASTARRRSAQSRCSQHLLRRSLPGSARPDTSRGPPRRSGARRGR